MRRFESVIEVETERGLLWPSDTGSRQAFRVTSEFRRMSTVQFLVSAYDGTDNEAIARRLKVRAEHIALGDKLVSSGNMLFGVAILDGDTMIGSTFVVDFPTRDDLDKWLEIEPYVVGDVWRRVEVTPCRVGPSFVHLLK